MFNAMSAPKGENLTWHIGEVDREDRAAAHGHRGAVLWFTGLSGSGKSTIGHRVERMLIERGAFAYVLDGDNIRHGLNSDLGFAPEASEKSRDLLRTPAGSSCRRSFRRTDKTATACAG